jgi:hemolysin III
VSVHFYPPLEEKINIISHQVGIALGVIASFLFILKSFQSDSWVQVVSYLVFSLSLIVLYTASTLYHSSKTIANRKKLKVFDHAAIYVFIAGSYTPLTLITLKEANGFKYFLSAWIMAVAGVILKLFYTGRFKLISTLLYVFMGWMIVFAFESLQVHLSDSGLFWLLAGGVSYTLGAIFYVIPNLKFNHAIFHVFVVLGSLAHVICVYFFVQ